MMEEEIKNSIHISEIPEGGILEIRYKGKTIAMRRGTEALKKEYECNTIDSSFKGNR